MPYEIVPVKGGYKVRKRDKNGLIRGRKYTSDKPMSLETARAQLRAIGMRARR